MNIKLFSLAKGEPSVFADSKKLISDCANVFTADSEKFSNFSSPKRLFIAVSQALRCADCVIIAVQSQSYNSIKKMLCSALQIKTEQKEEVYLHLLPLSEKGKISSTALENNSVFPVKSQIFATDDFQCCGYAVTSGGQSIVVVPLDKIKTANVVFGGLYGYLSEQAGFEETSDLTKIQRLRLTERLDTLLKKSNSTLAVANLNGVNFIEESINYVTENNVSFNFGNNLETRTPNQAVKDYLVSCVQKTRVDTKSDYALGVSSAFEDNGGSVFIYCAVADKNETVVTKLYANENETARDLVHVGVHKALELAGNCVAQKADANNSKSAKLSQKLRQNLIAVISVAVGGSAVIGTIMAFLLGN